MTREEAINEIKSWDFLEGKKIEAIHTLIPELRESEDERIRKEIVKYLTNELNNVEQLTPRTNEYERWITWLSLKFRVGDTISFKSKQYTIVEIDFDNHCYDLNDDECVDFDTAHYQFTLEKRKPSSTEETELNSIAFLEQLGYTCIPPSEQKPAERVEINKSLRDVVIEELNKYTSENYWRSPWALDSTGVQYPLYFANLGATWQKEQKPAEWSEEDEEIREEVIGDLCTLKDCIIKYDADWLANPVLKNIDKRISWLKFLRPQPHSVTIKDAIKFGNLEYERGVKDGIQSEKSHHWKPSEEQMKVFHNTMQRLLRDGGTGKWYAILESLYEDLKRL